MATGNHPSLEGVVVNGDHRGRLLGFPTANIILGEQVALPPDGVYAGYAEREDRTVYLSAISLGRRPTYYEAGTRLLEAHLLDFDGDLYGERLRVTIVEQIRGQLRFSSSDELVDQIRSDVARVRALLSGTESRDQPGEHTA